MRLFHVSEESSIKIFYPRLPLRKDLDPNTGLIWALHERCLPNFLTPRDCPRIAYHSESTTTPEDRDKFLSSQSCKHVVVVEHSWYDIIKQTTLYLYEFDATSFELQDETAGYYVSKSSQIPINKIVVTDIMKELRERNVELRFVDSLWDMASAIQKSSMKWSLCRMANAKLK
ncbi:hypothetical protein acsn021_42260 [Anaerocolumna cellulosilytica]|uniref:Uncharacterized protein n=1 Tax=Anaerocolumna cellulosilytica TaxID=433286 RepID=A0A6S6R975_9FIRM|nr:DUF6886 family protein [Anaerocolumna cellulosilytica]MBB5195185.1 hypothetical protein [Anaerocolumna cellulosilytica]BCJ96657.1 hypothetical protein acsn021_42260 [Anaerocolumna cellulosilytica]